MPRTSPQARPPAGFSFTAIRRLGGGATGEVWLADHPRFGRVAVKLVDPALGPEGVALLRAEHQRLMAIRHPHLVRTLALEEASDAGRAVRLALVLELVEGRPFADALGPGRHGDPRERSRPERRVRLAALGGQLLDALGAIHDHGLLHRDVKPDHVLVSASGSLKLLDLGLSGAGREVAAGTLRYLAPELLVGAAADPRSDLYSVGVLLFEALSGEVPFADAADAASFAWRKLNCDPPSPRERDPALPPALAALVHRLIQRDPARRPASAAETAWLLTAAVHEGSPHGEVGTSPGGTIAVRDPGVTGHTRELARMTETARAALAAHRAAVVRVIGSPEAGTLRLGMAWLAAMPAGVLAIRIDGRGEAREFAAFEPLVEEATIELSALDGMELLGRLPHGAALLQVSPRASDLPGFDLLPPLPALPPELELVRTGMALADLVRTLSSRRPLALLVVDGPACGRASRRALELLEAIEGVPVAIARIEEVGAGAPEPADVPGAVRPGPLAPAQMGQLARAALDAPVTAELEEWLSEVSQGLVERALDALRLAASTGALRWSGAEVTLDAGAGSALAAATWQASWIASLPAPARQALQALAVAGSAVGASELSALADLTPANAEQAAVALGAAGLLDRERDRLRLRGGSTAEAALASLSPPGRRALHARAATRAEARGELRAAAAHWLDAGDPSRARPHLLAAGRECQQRLAYGEMLRFAEAGLADPEAPSDQRLAFQAMRARSLFALGDRDAAIVAFDGVREGLAAAEPLRSIESERDALEALNQQAMQLGAEDPVLALLESFLERSLRRGDRESEAYARMRLGSLVSRQRPREAIEQLRRAISLFLSLRNHASLTLALSNLAQPLLLLGDTREALRVLARTRKLASLLGIPTLQVQCDLNRSTLLQLECRYSEGLHVARAALPEARRLAEHRYAGALEGNIAWMLFFLGHYAEAEVVASRSGKTLRGLGIERHARITEMLILACRVRCGDFGYVFEHAQVTAEAVARVAQEYLSRLLFWIAEAHQQSGDLAGAEPLIARAEATGVELGSDWTATEAAWLRARCLVRERRHHEAALLVPAALTDARRRRDLPLEAQLLAVLALANRDLATAEQALEVAVSSGDPEVELAARGALIELLEERGEHQPLRRERARAAEQVERTALSCGELQALYRRRADITAMLGPELSAS